MNGQITAELWSANLYLSMAFYMQREGLDGCAHWLKKQSEEETSHACQIAEYMVKRDATPLVDKVDVVPQQLRWSTRWMLFLRLGATRLKFSRPYMSTSATFQE